MPRRVTTHTPIQNQHQCSNHRPINTQIREYPRWVSTPRPSRDQRCHNTASCLATTHSCHWGRRREVCRYVVGVEFSWYVVEVLTLNKLCWDFCARDSSEAHTQLPILAVSPAAAWFLCYRGLPPLLSATGSRQAGCNYEMLCPQ